MLTGTAVLVFLPASTKRASLSNIHREDSVDITFPLLRWNEMPSAEGLSVSVWVCVCTKIE